MKPQRFCIKTHLKLIAKIQKNKILIRDCISFNLIEDWLKTMDVAWEVYASLLAGTCTINELI